MANITRYGAYSPIEDLFNEFARGFFVKPLAFPTPSDLQVKLDVKEGAKAEYKDGVLNLTLPKKPGTEARRISIA